MANNILYHVILTGLSDKGLFSVSGNMADVMAIRDKYNEGNVNWALEGEAGKYPQGPEYAYLYTVIIIIGSLARDFHIGFDPDYEFN